MPEHRSAPRLLRAGDRGDAVVQLRERLVAAGVLEDTGVLRLDEIRALRLASEPGQR